MSIQNMKLFDTRAETTKFITHEGKTLSAIEWGKRLGIKVDTLYHRLRRTDDPAIILRTDNLKRSK